MVDGGYRVSGRGQAVAQRGMGFGCVPAAVDEGQPGSVAQCVHIDGGKRTVGQGNRKGNDTGRVLVTHGALIIGGILLRHRATALQTTVAPKASIAAWF